VFFSFLSPPLCVRLLCFFLKKPEATPRPLRFLFFCPPLSSRFFLVLSSLRMPSGPVLSVFNARVKAAVFFFSGEEDEQC